MLRTNPLEIPVVIYSVDVELEYKPNTQTGVKVRELLTCNKMHNLKSG